MTLALVVLGSAAGAPLRYLADREIQRRHRRAYPLGTLVINVVGSFLLGVVVGLNERQGLPSQAMTALGVGLLGPSRRSRPSSGRRCGWSRIVGSSRRSRTWSSASASGC